MENITMITPTDFSDSTEIMETTIDSAEVLNYSPTLHALTTLKMETDIYISQRKTTTVATAVVPQTDAESSLQTGSPPLYIKEPLPLKDKLIKNGTLREHRITTIMLPMTVNKL
jgi:hypothetical protein